MRTERDGKHIASDPRRGRLLHEVLEGKPSPSVADPAAPDFDLGGPFTGD